MTDRVVDSAAPEEGKNTEFMKGIPHSENSPTHTYTHAYTNKKQLIQLRNMKIPSKYIAQY